MKNFIFIFCILIILFKTETVLSNNNIFDVNNIEISEENSKNNEELLNQAFKTAFNELIKRLLLEEDYRNLANTKLEKIKKLISYYQIINSDKDIIKNYTKFNISFNKNRMHNFFYNQNILYSDILNTDVILFPLLKKNNEYFIYTKNYFYENWNIENSKNLIEYTLPVENIENIQKIEKKKNNIFAIDISDFFKEYNIKNMVFAIIDIESSGSKIYLSTKINKKKINKNLFIERTGLNQIQFFDKIIIEIKNEIKDVIKSQNLIDVRTPSFLNVQIKFKNKSDLVEFNNRINQIDLIDNYYVQQISKDYALVKIKYLGKINKIINKLNDLDINLKMLNGQWEINII